MKRRVLMTSVLLLFALSATGFKPRHVDGEQQSYTEKQIAMLGLMRTIITFEVGEIGQHGAYSSWPVLLKNNPEEFNGWLARNWPSQAAAQGDPQRFSDMPEVLPGLKLRLEVSADGKRFSVLIEDVNDKQGSAFFGDERGIIREGKYIH